MRQNLSDDDTVAYQTQLEEARARDDKRFFKEMIAEIDRDITSDPNMRYTFIFYRFELGLTYPLRVPPMLRKMLDNFRDLLGKISARAFPPVILSVNCTATSTALTYFMTRLSQCSH